MLSTLSSRRRFGATLGSLLSAVGLTGAASPAFAAQTSPGKEVEKLGADGKAVNGSPFIMPIVRYQGVIYVAGQGAYDHRPPQQWDIESHTRKVMDKIKNLVERGGSSMEDILQLSVFLVEMDDYDGMNKVFKTYFPNGGPARTTVAVAALPGNSLVEVNCIAAVKVA
jgi:2-iminobutanoate/2-iminopropanoate deaminase